MPKGKLHLKRTPAEEAERALKKARKAARKAAKQRLHHTDDPYDDPEYRRKRRRTEEVTQAYDDSDHEYGPPRPSVGSSRAHKPDYDYDRIQAEVEEARFREKMYDAMGDDERLDSVEASLNTYAHVPRRWRGGEMDVMEDDLAIDPQCMEEEDYAEWVRAGMWRKKHAAEHEEQLRREAERKARREREKAVREETRRLERAAEEDRRRRRSQRERLRAVEAREAYDARWKELLAPGSATAAAEESLRFGDVPWPVMPPSSSSKDDRPVLLEDLTAEAISAFLLPSADVPDEREAEAAKKDRKEKLRETMLRFHPDKFEGRIMRLVRASDKEMVKEAVGVVARTLNTLMGEAK